VWGVPGRLAVVALLLAGCSLSAYRTPPVPVPPLTVPARLIPLFRQASAAYPELSAAQLAAQAQVESTFDARAVSPAGARGIMQFMPATWRRFGLDGDHDGRADPLDPADAIPAAARYDVYLAHLFAGLPGNRLSLVLAGYNAGPDAVRATRGIPPFGETRAYIRRVRAAAARLTVQFNA
jgi:soluble lytic murein transglycosylase-like protein